MSVSSQMCRVCLLGDDAVQLRNGHEFIANCNERLTLMECFHRCTQLDVEEKIDALSSTITNNFCSSCVKDLESAHNFITKAVKADKIIRARYLGKAAVGSFEWVNVKTEESSTEDESPSQFEGFPQKITQQPRGTFNEKRRTISRNNLKANPRESLEPKNNSFTKDIGRKSKIVSCDECKRTMEKRHLRRHILRCHRPKYLLCHACPRTFSVKSDLQIHELTHEVQRDGFTCEKCGKKLISKSSYRNHLKTHVADRKPVHKCDQCEKTFFYKGGLNLHQLQHEGAKIGCHLCEKKFVRRIDLMVHLRFHTGEKQYKCSKCEKSFAQKGVLNKHLQRHDNPEYACNFCDKKYASLGSLFNHRKKHTGMPYKCLTCGKEFSETYKIKRHIKGVHKIEEIKDICKYIINLKTGKPLK